MKTEIWKPIKNKQGYEVSNLGRVRHVKYIEARLQGKNHISVPFSVPDSETTEHIQIRRLVAEHFIKPLQFDSVVINMDGDVWNNAAHNLKVCKPNSCELSQDLPDETWLPVPNFDGKYEFSNMGRVRSLTRIINSPCQKRKPFLRYGKVLALQRNNMYNRPVAHLSDVEGQKYTTFDVALAVAKHFVDNPNKYKHIAFIDKNSRNLRHDNIKFTPAPNQPKPATVRKIKKLYMDGVLVAHIAKETRASISYIHNLCKNLPRPQKELRECGVLLYERGMRRHHIAQLLGVTNGMVSHWVDGVKAPEGLKIL